MYIHTKANKITKLKNPSDRQLQKTTANNKAFPIDLYTIQNQQMLHFVKKKLEIVLDFNFLNETVFIFQENATVGIRKQKVSQWTYS